MTFITEASKSSRRPFVLVRLQLDTCANVFSQDPCQAQNSVGMECYNTFGTCQDTDNYNLTSKEYVFSDVFLAGTGFRAIVDKVDTAPTEITPGKGLGGRANATVTFSDSADTDFDTDPYIDTRNYIASDQGTFWGKFLARNPHYYRRQMVIEYGFVGDNHDLTSVETYTYLIDRIEYNNKTGKCRIIGKDVLNLTDATKLKTPAASTGKLFIDIDELETSLQTFVIDDSEYDQPAGRLAIGDEVLSYTGTSFDPLTSVLTFTGVTRGAAGTAVSEHSNGDTVQRVRFWENVRVDQVIEDILVNDAGIDPSFLPITDWTAEADIWLSLSFINANIVKPLEINKAISELSEQCGFNMWAEDREGSQIKLVAEAPLLGADLASVVMITDNHIVKNSLEIKDETKDRISDVWFSHTIIDPTEADNKIANFDVTDVLFDADSISANAFNQRQIREIFSQWLRSSAIAGTTSSRLLRRFSQVPKRITFLIDASGPTLKTSDHFFLNSRHFQAADGSPFIAEFQVTSIDYMHEKSVYQVKALQFSFENNRNAFIAPDGTPDFENASDIEKELYAFISDDNTLTVDGLTLTDDNDNAPYLII